jgi:hypothetical protein
VRKINEKDSLYGDMLALTITQLIEGVEDVK